MPRGKRVLPKDIMFKGTHRQFKQVKRAQLRNLENALNLLYCGSAYAPMGPVMRGEHRLYVGDIQDLINAWRKRMSVKEWGR
jgi:hypothetical protein